MYSFCSAGNETVSPKLSNSNTDGLPLMEQFPYYCIYFSRQTCEVSNNYCYSNHWPQITVSPQSPCNAYMPGSILSLLSLLKL